MEFAVVIATLLSPLIALQVSNRLNVKKEKRARKHAIFQTLMATRGWAGAQGRLAPEHVRALNMIDIEFHSEASAKSIRTAWKAYLHHLNTAPPDGDPTMAAWNTKKDDMLVDLLHAMATALDYQFDKTDILTTNYVPRGMIETDLDAYELRKGLLGIVNGQVPVAMRLIPPPQQQQPMPPLPTAFPRPPQQIHGIVTPDDKNDD